MPNPSTRVDADPPAHRPAAPGSDEPPTVRRCRLAFRALLVLFFAWIACVWAMWLALPARG